VIASGGRLQALIPQRESLEDLYVRTVVGGAAEAHE
jgi:hypothetical protein